MQLADVGILDVISHLDRIGMAGLGVGGCWVIWKYWTKRIEDIEKAQKLELDEKDKLIAAKDDRIKLLQEGMFELSKAHAVKIESLQDKTIAKMDDWGGKTEQMVERMIEAQVATNETLRRLSFDAGSG